MSDVTFQDTETLGLDIKAPIWEFAAIRRTKDGDETSYHCFIKHHPRRWLKHMPDQFKNDYLARYRKADALNRTDALNLIVEATHGAHIVGAVPNFDTERIARLLRGSWWLRLLRRPSVEPSWHYHLIDVENLIVGHMRSKMVNLRRETRHAAAARTLFLDLTTPPWMSDDLSKAVGVDPDAYNRHTAMGDVEWVRDQFDAVMRPEKGK